MRFLGTICALVLATGLDAQGPALKTVVGEVTAVDAGAKQIKLKADKTDTRYTVLLTEKTSLLRLPAGETDLKKATPMTLDEVTAGDRMLARGPIPDDASSFSATRLVVMSKGDIAKKQERDRAEWQKRGIVGTVTSIDPATKQVTVAARGRDAKTVVVDATAAQSVKRYSQDSTKFADAKPAEVPQIQAGDTIRVLGDRNEDGTSMKAEEIVFGSFQTIAATISSIDTENGLVRVQDLNTKKQVDVAVTKDTLVRRLPPMIAQGMAARLRGGAGPGNGPGGPASGPGTASQGAPPANPPAGGANAPGGRASGGDIGQMLDRLPAVPLSELKTGDALIVSSARGADPSKITAFTLVAGVEPFLQAAPRSAGQINLGGWNLDGGIPEQ
jgi:hypothetical protein